MPGLTLGIEPVIGQQAAIISATAMARRSDEDLLLNLIPDSGEPVGNLSVLKKLGWEEEKYWRVRDRLLENGTLLRGRGKGGSIRRRSRTGTNACPFQRWFDLRPRNPLCTNHYFVFFRTNGFER